MSAEGETAPKVAIGISFGNSYSSIAYTTGEAKAEVIANELGDRQIPTVLSYVEGEEFQGTEAKSQLVRNSKNTVAYFRDFVGKEYVFCSFITPSCSLSFSSCSFLLFMILCSFLLLTIICSFLLFPLLPSFPATSFFSCSFLLSLLLPSFPAPSSILKPPPQLQVNRSHQLPRIGPPHRFRQLDRFPDQGH
jgi:hypothetical protein